MNRYHYEATPTQHDDDFESYTNPQTAPASNFDPQTVLHEINEGLLGTSSRMVHESDIPTYPTQTRSLDTSGSKNNNEDGSQSSRAVKESEHHEFTLEDHAVNGVSTMSSRKQHYDEAKNDQPTGAFSLMTRVQNFAF